jgi:hypothetical protein
MSHSSGNPPSLPSTFVPPSLAVKAVFDDLDGAEREDADPSPGNRTSRERNLDVGHGGESSGEQVFCSTHRRIESEER